MTFLKKMVMFHTHQRWPGGGTKWRAQRSLVFCGLVIAVAVLLPPTSSAVADGFADYDTTTAEEEPPPRKERRPADYLLYVPSLVLQLPVEASGLVVEGGVYLIEHQHLLPTLENWLSFVDLHGLYPIVSYKSTTGMRGGFGFHVRDLLGGGVGLGGKASYSTNLYKHASVAVGGEHIGGGPVSAMGEYGWRQNTRERFYGIGPLSRENGETNYGFQETFGSATVTRALGRHVRATAIAGYRRVQPQDGRAAGSIPHRRDSLAAIFAGEDLFGLFETARFVEIGGEVAINWLRRPGSPLGGGTERLRVTYVLGDQDDDPADIGFWRVRAELRHYFNLFRGRVIGIRILGEVTEPGAGTRIPFYELAKLGGSQTLRGYRSGRFTDRDMVAFTVEYRWPLWRRIDAFLFTDQGRVFRDIEKDFEFSDFRSSYGGGIRIWSLGGTESDFAIAKSPEGLKFYLRVGARP